MSDTNSFKEGQNVHCPKKVFIYTGNGDGILKIITIISHRLLFTDEDNKKQNDGTLGRYGPGSHTTAWPGAFNTLLMLADDRW